MKPKALLLDVMDTIVADPAYSVVLRFFEMSKADFFAVKSRTAYDSFERGLIDEKEFGRTYFTDRRSFDLAGLKNELRAGYAWVDGMRDLLSDLQAAGYPMHALSNYSEWAEMIEDKLELSRWLEWTFVSHRTALRKPEPRAYLHAAETLGLAPAECLFVDDRRKNVDGALAVGMQAVLFESADALRRRLLP